MIINFSTTEPDRLQCDLLVVGINEEERPPQSTAGLIDWRLHGFISEQIKSNNFTCAPGEFLLVPGDHRLQSRWILLCGLGSSLEMKSETIKDFCSESLVKAMQLRAKSCMLIYPHIITTAPFYRDALKWFLEGIGQAASNHLDSEYFSDLELYIPSKKEERVDVSKILMSKLIGRHGLTFSSSEI